MRIFITGGTGFFGKSMLDWRLRHPDRDWAKAQWTILSRSPERFAAANPRLARQPGVSFVAGDVRDFVFPEGRFDAIIHASTSAVTTLADDEMESVIVDGTTRMIDFAKASGCRTILFTSSGAVYGPRTAPAREDDECKPDSAYGKGKLAAERMLLDSGLDARIARCFAFVGPYLKRKIQYAIGNFIQDALDGRDLVVKGDGTPRRSYLYADDLVEWLIAILERGRPGGIYNVGSGESHSIAETARIVREALNSGGEIRICGAPDGRQPSVYVPDISRAQAQLGVKVFTPIEKAIRMSAPGDIIAEDIRKILSDALPWERLSGKTICITGANGMLAAYIVETLLALNPRLDRPVKVVALVRNTGKCKVRFSRWQGDPNLIVREWSFEDKDIGVPECNMMIHAASIPRPDSKRPVDVIGPNAIGTWNLLHYCHNRCKDFEQFLFFSSGAVYGDDFTEEFPVSEDMSFAVNQMSPASCYAESKRMGENICVSFARQYGIDARILRYAHTYGPGMDLKNDPRSFVSFINSMISGKDIVLMSKGDMQRYFCYISDATRAFFRVLFCGRGGEAYNIANEAGKISIYGLALLIARLFDREESCVRIAETVANRNDNGYAPQKYTFNPDTSKVRSLGFTPEVSVEEGFKRVIRHIHGNQGA